MEQQKGKLKRACDKLCSYRLKGSCRMEAGLYEKASANPAYTHDFKGDFDACALKVIATVVAVSIGACILKNVCGMLKGK